MTQQRSKQNGAPVKDLFSYIEGYGSYQITVSLMFFIIGLPASIQVLIMSVSTITPPWKCTYNSTMCKFNGTMSPDDQRRCEFPRSEWYYIEPKRFSMVTDLELDCDHKWMTELVSSMLFIGWGPGAIALGWISDRYGRKTTLFPSLGTIVIIGFISSFLSNIYLIMVIRFIVGFCIPGTSLQMFILISELVGNHQTPLAGILVFSTCPVGWTLLSILAYFVQDWRILSIVCTAPYLIFIIIFYKFVPESIRWLHLHGRNDEVMQIFYRIATWNKKKLPDNLNLDISAEDSHLKKSSPLDLFKTRENVLKSLCLILLWCAMVTCYYGLHMVASDLGGSMYRDLAIMSIAEVPSMFLAIVICKRHGRKRATLIPSVVGSLITIAIAFIPSTGISKIARIAAGSFGNLLIALAFYSIYPWSMELYPLGIRSQGMGLLQLTSHIASASAPWITIGLKPFGAWCPFVSLGCLLLVASFVSKWLTETKELASTNLTGNNVIYHVNEGVTQNCE